MVQAVETSSYQVALPGIRFNAWRWSPVGGLPAGGRRIVILHGVTSSALAFAGVARALAADGRTVDALDLPGHGGTRWTDESGESLPDQESVGRSAYDLRHVGELVAAAMHALPSAATHALAAAADDLHLPATGPRASALDGAPALLGHSWGAGVATVAVDAGAAVAQLVLEDPPFLTAAQAAEMAEGFRAELRPVLDEAQAVVRSWGPAWEGEDADARARPWSTRPPWQPTRSRGGRRGILWGS
ncbi:MAG TPA: alpha/beta fold hydrolase [Candidatus Acidoferrales bacterium]|nr:alpha/beta fold hydrolase [Candidatus Acidoferrales bacterium]